jgi:hypothetical protein
VQSLRAENVANLEQHLDAFGNEVLFRKSSLEVSTTLLQTESQTTNSIVKHAGRGCD